MKTDCLPVRTLPLLLTLACTTGAHAVHAGVITLNNGDTLNAEIIEQTSDGWRVMHPALGELVLPASAVLQATGADVAAADAAAPAEDAAPAASAAGTVDDGFALLKGWERKFEVGFSGANGNSDNRDMTVGFKGKFEDEQKRWALASLYAYSESDNVKSENDFYAELTRDWLYPGSPWFAFANARYDWDEFRDWDHRVSGAGGVGYQFLDDDTWSLAGRVGLGGNQTFGGPREEFTPEGIAGLDGAWQLSPAQAITLRTTFYPSLDDWGEYRNLTELNWEFKLATETDLAIKLGVNNEYDSLASGGTESNDVKYQGGLVLGF